MVSDHGIFNLSLSKVNMYIHTIQNFWRRFMARMRLPGVFSQT
jgi:hypothetical protein